MLLTVKPRGMDKNRGDWIGSAVLASGSADRRGGEIQVGKRPFGTLFGIRTIRLKAFGFCRLFRIPKKDRRSAVLFQLVGATGFEPATPCSQSRCATELRYTPKPMALPWEGTKVRWLGTNAASKVGLARCSANICRSALLYVHTDPFSLPCSAEKPKF